jgi:nitrite reductase/ring-hydroxylating ferredoxin subunit
MTATIDNAIRSNGRINNFMRSDRVTQGWYVAARSNTIRRGKTRSLDLLNRRIAIYRDDAGDIHTLDARCAHLGADLGHGCVVGDGLRCAFHGWRWGADGACEDAPGLVQPPARRVRSYPVQERWGLIWLWNGSRPLWELPDVSRSESLRSITLPPQTIRCHPHLVIANGLDAAHFEALHDMHCTAPPALTIDVPHRITLALRGKPRSPWLQRLTGSRNTEIVSRFTTIGGNLAWATIEQPIRFHVLFSGRPSPVGHCDTQTVVFVPRAFGPRLIQAALLLWTLLRDDSRILHDIQFTPGYTELDAPLRAFADGVDALPTG